MKKAFYLTLMTISAIFTFNMTSNNAYADTSAHVTSGPLTGPDGEDLHPGGHGSSSGTNNNQQYQTILHDPFSSWNSSIFSIRWGNPTMVNGILSLQHNSRVESSSIPMEANATYRITIGNLNGAIDLGISSYWNGLLLTERLLTSNGGSVSFNYTHNNPLTLPGQPVIIDIIGVGNSTLSSITIERQL